MKNNLLRIAREEREMTQEQLAELLGVKVQTVGAWEAGRRVPGLDKQRRLCDLFGMRPEQLGFPSEDSLPPDLPLEQNKEHSMKKKSRVSLLIGSLITLGLLTLSISILVPKVSFTAPQQPTPTPTSQAVTHASLQSPSSTPTHPDQPSSITIISLGKLNITGYCQSSGDLSSLDSQNKNAYGWTCVQPGGKHVLVDTDAACQWQYNQSNTLSRLTNFFDPNDWSCFSHVKNLGKVNFTQYCQSQGKEAKLIGNTVYDWRCGSAVVGVDDACRKQYNDSQAIATIENYYDPNGWACLGQAA